ncbi:hypothetical protein [Flavobacterium sp. ASW18X]|uniref:hypothetical protein n=1 Tax=Flavobacterium sp. ASW18X TaxID=2572595 RepID=UPI0010AEA39D|nr:hypothetical protein [Flavobacterium sp. ASW18X]TKD62461.1 hypothetical protein FBT53_09500 [Flavobacterium sp. ASW18X]
MKMLTRLTILVVLLSCIPTNAQVHIGGHIEIGIDLPEVVVINRRRPAPPRRQPAPHRCTIQCNHHNLGKITHQNYGSVYSFYVEDALANIESHGEIFISLFLDDGNQMEIYLKEYNRHNPNFNYYKLDDDDYDDDNMHHNYNLSNRIIEVRLNGRKIKLRNGAISLQAHRDQTFGLILNLHSRKEGNFNGKVSSVFIE